MFHAEDRRRQTNSGSRLVCLATSDMSDRVRLGYTGKHMML